MVMNQSYNNIDIGQAKQCQTKICPLAPFRQQDAEFWVNIIIIKYLNQVSVN